MPYLIDMVACVMLCMNLPNCWVRRRTWDADYLRLETPFFPFEEGLRDRLTGTGSRGHGADGEPAVKAGIAGVGEILPALQLPAYFE